MGRNSRLIATLCALAGFWGCGGGGSTAPTAVATPTPASTPVPAVVLLNASFGVQNGYVVLFRAVSASASGTLEITVDWTAASNDLDIALVRGACTGEMYEADECTYIGFADSLTAKPERLRMNVTAGTYTALVDNYGPGDESGAIQIVFTPGATATAADEKATVKTTRSKKPGRLSELR